MTRTRRIVFPERLFHGKGRSFFSRLVPLFFIFLLMPFSGAQAQGSGPALPQPGFRSIGLWDPAIPIRMDIAVWYPSPRIPREIALEGWTIRAGQNGVTVPGKYPVILLSHTTAASRLASHDLAAALARHGFMVIAPTHPNDCMDDTSGVFSAALFADRPKQLLLALEAVEKHTLMRHIMDRSRVGVLGIGAGAATALQLAGARPDLSRLNAHCRLPESAVSADPLCSEWAKLFHPRMQAEFAALLASGAERFTPVMYPKEEPLPGDVSLNDLAGALLRETPPVPVTPDSSNSPSSPDSVATPPAPEAQVAQETLPEAPSENGDPMPADGAWRKPQPILAVGLLTPGLIDLFPDAVLQNISAPVGILAVADDAVYPAGKSVDRLQRLLAHRPASRVLQKTGHHDVQPPCPPMFQESFPALCGSQDRTAETSRKIRNEFFVRFFQKNLGVPGPPPLLPSK